MDLNIPVFFNLNLIKSSHVGTLNPSELRLLFMISLNYFLSGVSENLAVGWLHELGWCASVQLVAERTLSASVSQVVWPGMASSNRYPPPPQRCWLQGILYFREPWVVSGWSFERS